jgi:hypothetical protein
MKDNQVVNDIVFVCTHYRMTLVFMITIFTIAQDVPKQIYSSTDQNHALFFHSAYDTTDPDHLHPHTDEFSAAIFAM